MATITATAPHPPRREVSDLHLHGRRGMSVEIGFNGTSVSLPEIKANPSEAAHWKPGSASSARRAHGDATR
jgi:hypothetical protein